MKTTSIPNTVLAMVVAVFTTIQVNSAIASTSKRVEAVRYQNTWIPSVELKAVEITATRTKAVLSSAVEYKGDIIPSVQMADVKIKASGVYTPEDVAPLAVGEPKHGQYRMEVAQVNGVYMPTSNMAPVTISAGSQDIAVKADDAENTTTSRGIFQARARKTFDVVVNYMAEKANNLLRSLISGMSKEK